MFGGILDKLLTALVWLYLWFGKPAPPEDKDRIKH